MKTELSDEIAGRVWEHMWQFLFLGEPVVCEVEWRALCAGWGVCFESQGELEAWKVLAKERKDLEPTLGKVFPPKEILDAIDGRLRTWKEEAEKRGASMTERVLNSGDSEQREQ